MATPRVLILRAPGTNCDEETAFAFRRAGGAPQVIHLNRLVEEPQQLLDYQILCIPGGFSFGDDIAAGRIFASQMLHHVIQVVQDFHTRGNLILGICNGFQVLLKAGLLVRGEATKSAPATLTWNDSQRFEDRWVNLSTSGSECVFLRDIESLYLPIAHAEGKFVAADEEALAAWDASGQLALRYATCHAPTEVHAEPLNFPANPNGSQRNVAGVCDETGRIFGLMPHPERYIDPLQHPRWTREPRREAGDGLKVFQNAIDFFG